MPGWACRTCTWVRSRTTGVRWPSLSGPTRRGRGSGRSFAGRCRRAPARRPRGLCRSLGGGARPVRAGTAAVSERRTVARVCAATRAIAADLARMAAETAGRTGRAASPRRLRQRAAGQHHLPKSGRGKAGAVYPVIAGLEFMADDRLGRPLGTFDRPRPERAEARASAGPSGNVRLSLAALERLAVALVPASPQTQAAFDRASAAGGWTG